MRETVRAFFEHLVDYAGLFPPARLPLAQAVANYLREGRSPESWLLGRFVCPASGLRDLERQLGSDRLAVAALGRGGASLDEFRAGFKQDLADIEAFRHSQGQAGAVTVFETALPTGCSAAELEPLFAGMLPLLTERNLRGFFEVPVAVAGPVLGRLQAGAEQPVAGLKLRCGGPTPAAIPAPPALAHFLRTCRVQRLPWKATAGLHHPLRHHDAELGARQHGFLNVFAAGILDHVHALEETTLVELLADESPASFRFEADHFAWKTWTCSVDDLRAVRRHWLPSFGSCSFDEPRDDLRALGLI